MVISHPAVIVSTFPVIPDDMQTFEMKQVIFVPALVTNYMTTFVSIVLGQTWSSYWADVSLIDLLWSLALLHRIAAAHRWFPPSPHHYVLIGISCWISSIRETASVCSSACFSFAWLARRGVLLSRSTVIYSIVLSSQLKYLHHNVNADIK